jgi:predicted NBD/HSP70 family sugar kinase
MPAPLTPKKVFAAARRGHPAAMEAVEIEATRLALGIAAIAPVVDPALVILGGGVGHNGDLLLGPIERELAAISPFHPNVVVSALGEEAVLNGAVATALDAARDRLFARTQTA